ncbi:MAG: cobyrinate a,c-diamide synthase [Cyanobium sp. D14.bin.5]|nr:cobyrinate a,c-diamide synthase [Cyanobium sp. D14.bin.5]
MACLIAAPSSGSGKTLLSLCLAAWARAQGLGLQPFKVGPDYLDPQLLSRVSGHTCRNLDPLLCGPEWLERCFSWHGSRADLALVEGVMGLFDGRGPSSEGSSAAVAAQLGLPVVFVVEASRQAGSLAALVRGFRDHGPPAVQLAGVVLNRVGSERHHALLAEALASIEVPLLGVLPHHPSLELPSRHLGLLPPEELQDLEQRQEQWAELAARHLDLKQLVPLLAPPAAEPGAENPIDWCLRQSSHSRQSPHLSQSPQPLPVAIASDAAFHFRYPEAGELLEAVGLEPRAWSPLADEPLPDGCRAVLLPGGYPELHTAQLAASRRSLGDLARAAAAGLPLVAECGGLLLLGEQLADGEGQLQPMAGVLPFKARKGALSLGYRTATATANGLLVRPGESFCGHEFHRWQLEPLSNCDNSVAAGDGLWQLDGWGTAARSEGWTAPNVHASWLHLHWAGCPVIPSRLAAAAARAAPLPTSAASCSPTNPGPRSSKNAGV